MRSKEETETISASAPKSEDLLAEMQKETTKFTCGMCYEEFDLTTEEGQKQANVKFLSECGHAFCGECFGEYYRTMIELQYMHDKLKCP